MPLKVPSDLVPTWKGHFDTGNLDGILDLYADDLVAVPEPGARLHGKDQLRAGLQAFLSMSPCTLEFAQDGLVEGNDTALCFGSWSFDGNSPVGPVHIEARATLVLVQKADGWYVTLDDFFSQG